MTEEERYQIFKRASEVWGGSTNVGQWNVLVSSFGVTPRSSIMDDRIALVRAGVDAKKFLAKAILLWG